MGRDTLKSLLDYFTYQNADEQYEDPSLFVVAAAVNIDLANFLPKIVSTLSTYPICYLISHEQS